MDICISLYVQHHMNDESPSRGITKHGNEYYHLFLPSVFCNVQQVADSKKTDNSVCNTGVQTIELQSISVTAELTCTVTIKKPAGRVARPMDRVTKRRGACTNRSTGRRRRRDGDRRICVRPTVATLEGIGGVHD